MNENSISTRDHSLDNIRFFLILFVVFAHLLEVCRPFSGKSLVYQLFYSFHMPAFIFLFGYNVRFSPKRIIFRWLIPYVIFQSLYIIFAKTALMQPNTSFQFTTPYWLCWYMLACIFYQLVLPLFDKLGKRLQITFLFCSFIVSLLVGFVDFFGYYLSLSRFFVFLPWFLLGHYCKKNKTLSTLSDRKVYRYCITVFSAIIIALSVPFLLWAKLPNGLLYGSYSYRACGSTVWMRSAVSLMSLAWISLLFAGLKPFLNKNLFLITKIGQNTLPIFLLHGFFVKAIPLYFPALLSAPWKLLSLTLIMLALFGNKLLSKAIYYISFSWTEKIFSKRS